MIEELEITKVIHELRGSCNVVTRRIKAGQDVEFSGGELSAYLAVIKRLKMVLGVK